MYRRDYDMGDAGVVGEQREERVVVTLRVVEGLVVYDQTRTC